MAGEREGRQSGKAPQDLDVRRGMPHSSTPLPRWEKLFHLSLLLLCAATGVTGVASMAPWELGILALLALSSALSVFAAWRGWVVVRQGVAVTLLLVGAGFLFGWLGGFWPFAFAPLHDARHVTFIGGVTALAALGVFFRTVWGRWIALGLALGGVFSGGLNAAWFLFFAPGCAANAMAGSTFLLFTLWSMTIAASLAGPAVAGAFLARSRSGELWGSSHRLVRVVRWTILANLVAVPMLLVYGWVQPVVPTTTTSAFVLAGVLGLGTMLAMARKVVGALLLCLGGLGLLAQTLVTLWLGEAALLPITSYYAVFWLPAALASFLCALVLARPLWRLLRA